MEVLPGSQIKGLEDKLAYNRGGEIPHFDSEILDKKSLCPWSLLLLSKHGILFTKLSRHRHISLYKHMGRGYRLLFSELPVTNSQLPYLPRGIEREARELRTQLRGKSGVRSKELRPVPLEGNEDQTPGETRGRHRVQKGQKVSPVQKRRLVLSSTSSGRHRHRG